MALFITFEGGEGSGKSTQARILYRRLSKLSIPVLSTHEPGGTRFGQKIGRWLKWGQNMKMSALTELMLFNASRAQLVEEVLHPALRDGKIVICDRYIDSTVAYQSHGRGLPIETVRVVNKAATQGLTPDLTVLMDVPVAEGLVRKGNKRPDRFEQEGIAFHQRVRDGYLKLAASEPKRWLVVDSTQSKEKASQKIWEKVSQLLSRQG